MGRDAVRLMNALGIAIDLSHVGDRTALDAIGISTQPVLATHADARALVDLPRNKSDDVIKAIAETGGVIGASVYGPMLWNGDATRRPTIDDFVRHLEHIVEIAGIDHVGFGTDLPAARDLAKTAFEAANRRLWSGISRYGDAFGHDIPARYPLDANAHAKLPNITEALIARGWRPRDIEAYLASGEWRGKAGGYAAQGLAGSFIVKIVGSYTNIVGLPLYETATLLSNEGFPIHFGWLNAV